MHLFVKIVLKLSALHNQLQLPKFLIRNVVSLLSYCNPEASFVNYWYLAADHGSFATQCKTNTRSWNTVNCQEIGSWIPHAFFHHGVI